MKQIIEQVESGWCNWVSIVYVLRESERTMREREREKEHVWVCVCVFACVS